MVDKRNTAISNAASIILQFQSKHTLVRYKMLKHVIRSLTGTEYYGIILPNLQDGIHILCWTYGDWGRDLSNRKSRTGVLITLNRGPMLCTSKLKTKMDTSSSEAKFNTLLGIFN